MTWEETQLDNAGYVPQNGARAQSIRTAVLRLLDVWSSMEFLQDGAKDEILTTFSTLARGHALDTGEPDIALRWFMSTLVRPRLGDVVRVRTDAFDLSDDRHTLNGKRGRVVRITRGMYVVALEGIAGSSHFRPEWLETQREVVADA